MNDDLNQVTRRVRQYWFADGLAELSVGGAFIVLGLYFYLQSTLPSGSLVLLTIQAGFVVLLFGVIFLSRYLVSKFKARLTFPRTGYVSYNRASKKQRIVSAGTAILIVALNLALFLNTPLSLNWIPAITGLIVGIVWLISAIRVGLIRFYLQSILSLLLGVGLSLARLETYQSLAVYYAAMGIVLLISGGVTLAKYLRQYPTSENDSPA
ncbi:MAG: hypothetical protein IMY85_03015 [Chloroflexi bacterium]|nr:hypothetical protein [Chloroflexota bacterium]